MATMAYHGYKAVRAKSKKARRAALKNMAWEAVGLIPGAGRVLGRGMSRAGHRMVQKSYRVHKAKKKVRKTGRKLMKYGGNTQARYSSRPYRAYEYGHTGASFGASVHSSSAR